mgnify:CR=1 FL=1
MPLLLFIRKFIDDNPLCVCRGEVAHIQHNLIQEGDVIKLKQKTSQIHLTVHGGAYFIKVCFTVPDLYPLQKLGLVWVYSRYTNSSLVCFISLLYVVLSLACTQPFEGLFLLSLSGVMKYLLFSDLTGADSSTVYTQKVWTLVQYTTGVWL